MLRLFDGPLAPDAQAALVRVLEADGAPESIAAAARMKTVTASEFAAISLTDAQREAVMRVLAALDGDAPPELAGLLAHSPERGSEAA
jgi:hypothetical protein